LGRHLAQWLVARGEQVDDVASTATAQVRELSRGGRRKNDVIDAAAAASVAALGGSASAVRAEGTTSVPALLDERRANLVAGRTRLVNQLHALLRDLIPGGAATNLSAAAASKVLVGVRPVGPLEAARKALAKDIVAELRDTDRRIKAVTAQIAEAVTATGTSLTGIDGVGPVLADRFLARTRDPRRFPTRAAFACYAGVAPVEVASAGLCRLRHPP
jgi:transposase